jgi:hypothetical protein
MSLTRCTRALPRAQAGRKDHARSENRGGGVGCRCEVKSSEVKADEKVCRVSGQRSVKPQSARKEVGGPAEAARRAFNDAMLMCAAAQNIDERARNDFLMLSRYVANALPRFRFLFMESDRLRFVKWGESGSFFNWSVVSCSSFADCVVLEFRTRI